MLELLGDMIADLGAHDVLRVADARAAWPQLEEFRPDLMICDLSMPEMDGIEFLRLAAERRFGAWCCCCPGWTAASCAPPKRWRMALKG
jgi:CheY-like chemotaxis protein